jgi:hypothetical protein
MCPTRGALKDYGIIFQIFGHIVELLEIIEIAKLVVPAGTFLPQNLGVLHTGCRFAVRGKSENEVPARL